MSARKLSSTTHFQPVPFIVKSSLRKVKVSNAKYKPYPIGLPSLATDLIKSYFQKGLIEEAHKLFNEMSYRDVVVWTTMISGYTPCYQHNHAWTVFCEMLKNGVEPNALTFYSGSKTKSLRFSIAARACTPVGSEMLGEQLHVAVITHGFESNLPVMNSMLDMYCRSGCTDEAKQTFLEMSERFNNMEYLDSWILKSLSAYSHEWNQKLHGGILCRGFNNDLLLSNALIDMYAKCGSMSNSHKIFGEMLCTDLVLWTSLMIGYGAQHGHGKKAVELFYNMIKRSNEAAWAALLGGSEVHKLPSMVKLAALKVLDLKPDRVGPYVMLSNIYAASGRDNFANFRKLMRGTGNKKEVAHLQQGFNPIQGTVRY
ncbi:hypothetical protein K1719_018891 [Acacia pycnantha]|nr:hypothetical protein K1719_018891 [Acacia pycnantha]